jgi:hypothetical protein
MIPPAQPRGGGGDVADVELHADAMGSGYELSGRGDSKGAARGCRGAGRPPAGSPELAALSPTTRYCVFPASAAGYCPGTHTPSGPVLLQAQYPLVL